MATTRRTRRRTRRWVLAVVAVVVGLVLAPTVAAAMPSDQIGPCGLITDPAARATCENVQNVVSPLAGVANQVLDSSIVQPILQGIARAEAEAIGTMLLKMYDYLNSSSTPDLTASWFLQQYAIVLGLSFFLMFFTGYGRAAMGMKNQDIGEVGKASGSMIVFFIVAPTLPFLIMAIWKATDPVTQAFMHTAGQQLNQVLAEVSASLAKANFADAILLPLLVMLLGTLGAAITWVMLFFVTAALYIFTAAEVVGLAMWVGGRWTNDMFRRTTLSLIGLLLFKPIMAFTLAIGVGLLGHNDGQAEPVLMGATICLLVPIIAWMAYKRIANHHINEGAIWARMRGVARAVARQ